MTTKKQPQELIWLQKSPEIIDLLATTPSTKSFTKRLTELSLSPLLNEKILQQKMAFSDSLSLQTTGCLTLQDESELGTEVLLYRHRFTELIKRTRVFRQAALTVIQNIYLFQNRKIYFGVSSLSAEQERQDALLLFSNEHHEKPLPLTKTFQHLILARIWNRILSQTSDANLNDDDFKELHLIVERLNTLRNIYMMLSTSLVKKLVTRINKIYKSSVSYEDAVQIGNFGIARAAYRYHQSCGVRFSTYAANWVFKEIQRQSLTGRLIKISTHTVEQYARSVKEGNSEDAAKYSTLLQNVSSIDSRQEKKTVINSTPFPQNTTSPAEEAEKRQLHAILINAINQILPEKSGDIIKRRYGLPPYDGIPQSIIYISKQYGVTRGSIYQQENKSLQKLSLHLKAII